MDKNKKTGKIIGLSGFDLLDLVISGKMEYADPLVKRCCPSLSFVQLIGRGGEGLVFETWHNKIERPEVLKIRRGKFTPEVSKRFFRGVRIMDTITQRGDEPFPSIYDVKGSEEIQGCPAYIRMQFIRGENLTDYLLKSPRMTLKDKLRLFIRLGKGLSICHDHGIVHRDVKPDNILVDKTGLPFWVDFGIAKSCYEENVTLDNRTLGTLNYASPEQIEDSASVDYLSDIYSFGKVLYFLVVGNASFNPMNLRTTPELTMIFSRSTQRNPARRFQSVEEFLSSVIKAYPEWDLGSGMSERNEEVARAFMEIIAAYGYSPGRVKKIFGINSKEWSQLLGISREYLSH